jgi:hypothetical protein
MKYVGTTHAIATYFLFIIEALSLNDGGTQRFLILTE